jgi:hypothetical protein
MRLDGLPFCDATAGNPLREVARVLANLAEPNLTAQLTNWEMGLI